MLKIMRNKKVAKLVLWGTLILILPAFVIWGAGSLGRSKDKGPAYVGLIDDRKVTFDDFAESLTAVRCQIFLNLFTEPKTLEALIKNKEFLGRLAWDMLVMSREAKKRKIKTTDAEVINFIRNHPLFSRNGKFDDRIYEYALKNNFGLYPRNFEEIVRQNIAIQKMNALLTSDIKVTDEEVLEAYKLNGEKFKVAYTFADPKTPGEITTPLFSKSDYIEGVGEALPLAEAAVKMKAGDVSAPVTAAKGSLVFRLIEVQPADMEKFAKEKDEFAKKVLTEKKNKYLEGWLRRLEANTKLLIDLGDYEKYYR